MNARHQQRTWSRPTCVGLCGESNHKLGHIQADAQGHLRVLLIVIIKQEDCDALFYPFSL